MRATLVRHAQSTGNAGEPTDDLATMPLTALGWQQAVALAASWSRAPSHIVSSPFLRTRQTAEPTRERFADVPHDIWPIEEFTYLEPARWNGTSRVQRLPVVEAYWQRADPDYVDGPGAESFANVMRRAEVTLAQLQQMPPDAEVSLFTHGQFMQALRQSVLYPQASVAEKMAGFRAFDQRMPVLNCQKLSLTWIDGAWSLHEVGGSLLSIQ